MKKQIHDENRGYRILLPLVSWMFRHSYRHIKYVGEENIPQDGAVIFAPNHTNALQDALAVLSINSERKVFVARADIFRKPFLCSEHVYIYRKDIPSPLSVRIFFRRTSRRVRGEVFCS